LKSLLSFKKKTDKEMKNNLSSYFWVAKDRGFSLKEKDFSQNFSRSFRLLKEGKNIQLLFNLNFALSVVDDVYKNKRNTFLMRHNQGTLPDMMFKLENTRYFPLGYMLVVIGLLKVNLRLGDFKDDITKIPVFNYYEETIEEYLEKLKKETPIELRGVIKAFLRQLKKELKKQEEFKMF